jgi:hypothetical protein
LTEKSIHFIAAMQPPDLSRCTEEELWHYVAWHLEGEGIHSVLVGGAVVAIYTEGLYRSGDLDMVDLDAVRDWCAGEGGVSAFEELVNRLNED